MTKSKSKETKKKLTRELERAKADLVDEKKETKIIVKDNKRLTTKIHKEKADNQDTERDITLIETEAKDLKQEKELTELDLDVTSTHARRFKQENTDLANERNAMQEETAEVLEHKEAELKEQEDKYLKSLEQLQGQHVQKLKKIDRDTKAVEQNLEELGDTLDGAKKSGDKLAVASKKLEKQNVQTARQLDIAQAEKNEMETKKRSLEKELAKAASYLNTEKKATKAGSEKVKLLSKKAKKKEGEVAEDKKKRTDLEGMKEDLAQEEEQTKDNLAKAAREKSALKETTLKLQTTLQAVEEERDRVGSERDETLQNLSKNYQQDINKIKKKATTETKSIESKKRATEGAVNGMAEELEIEEKKKQDLLDEARRLDDEVEQLAKKAAAEANEKLVLQESKKKLERELNKAKTYLEDGKKAKEKEERAKRKLDKQAKKAKQLAASHEEEKNSLQSSKLELESQLQSLESQLLDAGKKTKKVQVDEDVADLEKSDSEKEKGTGKRGGIARKGRRKDHERRGTIGGTLPKREAPIGKEAERAESKHRSFGEEIGRGKAIQREVIVQGFAAHL